MDNMKQNAWFDTVPPWEAEMAWIGCHGAQGLPRFNSI